MVAHDPWGPSLLPHDSVILIMQLLCHISRYLIQLHSSCVHFVQQEGKREREIRALFLEGNFRKQHIPLLLPSHGRFSDIKHIRGNWAAWSSFWAVMSPAFNK